MDKDTLKWGSRLIYVGSLNISFWFVFTDIPYHFLIAGITFCLGGVLFFYDGDIILRGKIIFFFLISTLSFVLLFYLSLYFTAVQSSSFFTHEIYFISICFLMTCPVLFCWIMSILSSSLNPNNIRKKWNLALKIAAAVYILPAFISFICFAFLILGFKGELNFSFGINTELNERTVIFYYINRAVFLIPLGYINYVLIKTAKNQQSLAP